MLPRRLLIALPAAALLGACGFELRRAPELKFSTVQLVETAAQAQVVLEALSDAREKSVVASTAAGQVRELQLRARLVFRLRTPAGKELIPATEISLKRDMSFTESAALAKEQEEALLHRAMQSDIVAQVMRRLAAVQAL